MARVCQISGKKTVFGNNRSHSMRATSRSFKPNLITKMVDLGNGIKVKIKMAANMYKKYKTEL